MLRANLIVIAVVLMCLISLGVAVLEATREPGMEGRGKDSYGIRFYGLRGVYETMQLLGLPVERNLIPPDGVARRAGTLVLWSPSPTLMAMETEYVRNLRDWVEQGGRLVVAAGRRHGTDILLSGETLKKSTLPELLELEGLDSGVYDQRRGLQAARKRSRSGGGAAAAGGGKGAGREMLRQAEKSAERITDRKEDGRAEEGARGGRGERSERVREHERNDLRKDAHKDAAEEAESGEEGKSRPEIYTKDFERIDLAEQLYGHVGDFRATFNGAFRIYAPGAAVLALPEKPEVIYDFGRNKPIGTLEIEVEGKPMTLAAIFRIGKGELVYVADSALLFNRFFSRGGNAALGVRLLLGQKGGRVIFDEFYHGLNLKGNPFWLLSRLPYGLIAACLVLGVALWAWRSAERLGPPMECAERSRRSMREYITAMALLFSRADTRRYIFVEVYKGALWHIRRELRLGPKSENCEDLTRALARSDPERARRLESACAHARTLLAREKINRSDAVKVVKEINQCL